MNKFKAGDKVKVDYDSTIYEVIEFDQAFQLYVVSSGKDVNGQDVTHGYTERALKPVSLPFSTNNGVFTLPTSDTYTLIRFDGTTGTITLPKGESIYLKALKDQAVHKTECNHSWQSYFGLNERYEYCTKCNQKRGHL